MIYTVPKRRTASRKPRTARTAALLVIFAALITACNTTPTSTPQATGAATTNVTATVASVATKGVTGMTGTVTGTPAATTIQQHPTAAVAEAATPTVQAGATTFSNSPGGQAPLTETPIASTEQPVAPEQNPVGDIPDNQAFVQYTSAAGSYALQVPEGWARTENGTDVSFMDKLDGVSVSISNAATAPTAKTAPGNEIAALQKSGRAVKVSSVKDVQLPAGPAVLVEYTSNSDPNAVTGKQVRLEDNAYLFFNNGKLATLTLWAPLGADNVDQWQLIAKSFTWK